MDLLSLKLIAFSIIYFALFISIIRYHLRWSTGLILAIFFILFLRFGGFQGDFQVYFKEFRSEWHSIYYLKEPLFWVFSKFIFSVVKNELLVILLYDFIFVSFLIISVKKVTKISFFFILLGSFPILFGLENIYRQVLGLPFIFIFIYHCTNRQYIKSFWYLLIATLFHNVYLIFFPFLLFYFLKLNLSYSLRFLLFILSYLFIFNLFNIIGFSPGFVGKSTAQNTGLDLKYLYLLVLIIVYISLSLINKKVSYDWLFVGLFTTCTYIFSLSFLGSAQSERIGMILLPSVFYAFLSIFNQKNNMLRIIELEMIIILILPILFFSSSRRLLF